MTYQKEREREKWNSINLASKVGRAPREASNWVAILRARHSHSTTKQSRVCSQSFVFLVGKLYHRIRNSSFLSFFHTLSLSLFRPLYTLRSAYSICTIKPHVLFIHGIGLKDRQFNYQLFYFHR